jgi:hypothetical protein
VAVFYGQCCHPHKSDHTLGETYQWFDTLGLEPWGSFPPVSIRAALSALRRRADLLEAYPLRSRAWNRLLRGAWLLPRRGEHLPRRAGRVSRAGWQAVYAFMGRKGDYSWGAALSARKPG